MKIICIENNYPLKNRLALEMKPFFIVKGENSFVSQNRPFFIPEFSKEIYCGVHLVLKICRLGKFIKEKFAHKYYSEIGIGVDFTAMDILQKCIKNGLPWTKAKAFDGSSATGEFLSKQELNNLKNINFSLTIDGKKVQHGNSKDLIYFFDHIISYVSQFITLKMGDLIYTGVPSDLIKVKKNNHLEGFIENQKMLNFWVK